MLDLFGVLNFQSELVLAASSQESIHARGIRDLSFEQLNILREIVSEGG